MVVFRLLIVLVCLAVGSAGCLSLPDPQKVEERDVHYLDQNWTPEMRHLFYHTAQGSRMLPYDWFIALEQPSLSLLSDPGMFTDPDYLSRFGFIPDRKADPKLNPDSLPVGFARDPNFVDPITGQKSTVVGLTCAACHTGELHIMKNDKRVAVRIEGGPAMTDPGTFTKALGLAIGLTQKVPGRFDRFARRVLKSNYNEQTAKALEQILDKAIEAGKHNADIADQKKLYEVEGGFSRTDALGRILNMVFGWGLSEDNLAPVDAPVNFPHIWNAPHFTWVQYNGSIHQPIVRNAGEALGVRAPANLKDRSQLYKSSVDIRNLDRLEGWLSGHAPFKGLQSPKWPEAIFGKIDRKRAAQGKTLYNQHCGGCHLPPMEELEQDLSSSKPRYWTRKFGPPLLKVKNIKVALMGTDRTLLENFLGRTVISPGVLADESGKPPHNWEPVEKRMSMELALGNVTENVINKWYIDHKIPPEERNRINGNRKNLIRAEWTYKARPLNGVWATAPFLHNGSVPTLYQLLSPVKERMPVFYLGTREFDTENVGFKTGSFSGGFKFDTTTRGNANTGHEFTDGPIGNGVIGPKLTPEERKAIIEFLKSQ